MAITWQNVGAPNLAGATQVLNNSSQGITNSLSSLAKTVKEQGAQKEAKDASNRRLALEKDLATLALNADNEVQFKSDAYALAKANGLSNEETSPQIDSALAFRNAASSLTGDEQSKYDSLTSNIDNITNSKIAQLDERKNKEGLALEKERESLFGSNLDFQGIEKSLLASVQDSDEKDDLSRGIGAFKSMKGYSPQVKKVALSMYSNPEVYEDWLSWDGVFEGDVKDSLESIAKQVKLEQASLEKREKDFSTNYAKSLEAFNSIKNKEIGKINSEKNKIKKDRLKTAAETMFAREASKYK